VLTTYDADAGIVRATEAGATGYLLKDATRDDLMAAIRAAAAGESVLAPSVATRLMDRMRAPMPTALSTREKENLQLVAEGRTNKQIATTLHLGVSTVKTHLLHVFAKLGVEDRTQAVTTAAKPGYLHLQR
jgi:DNA-binding NarL/FixJ family response regulator